MKIDQEIAQNEEHKNERNEEITNVTFRDH